jgi:Protein of unknown function (DUF1580)
MQIANTDLQDLIPLNQAIRNELPGNPSPTTVWRWATRGVAPANPGEDRIKLEVLYCGRRPYTTRKAIHDFLQRATESRLARIEGRLRLCSDASDEEIDAAGLK